VREIGCVCERDTVRVCVRTVVSMRRLTLVGRDKVGDMCVCVCVYVYECVCVCVCVYAGDEWKS